jgi:hypothetical protein
VLVVMDQFTRRIIGFGIHTGAVDGIALCRMFNRIIAGMEPPRYLSSDHDPLFKFIGGKRTGASLTSKKLRASLMFLYPILSLSV